MSTGMILFLIFVLIWALSWRFQIHFAIGLSIGLVLGFFIAPSIGPFAELEEIPMWLAPAPFITVVIFFFAYAFLSWWLLGRDKA
jgi:hypothetical protein